MHNLQRFHPVLLFGLGLAFAAPPASAQQFGETVTQRGRVHEDLYVAGGRVDVNAQVEGDVAAAGGRVTIEDQVDGDVFALGRSIDLRARVKDDARLSGGEVTVHGPVGDDLLAAGGTVTVTPEATIGGRAWLAGGTLDIAGRIGKGLKAAGGTVVIGGEVLGDADIAGEHIELRPGAKIHGRLHYRSPNAATIDPDAQVLDGIVRAPLEAPPARGAHAGGVFVALSLFVTATALFLLFPHFAPSAARGVRDAPWKTLGLGLAVLAGGPLVVVLLLASVLGLWLGLLLLLLYVVLLLLGYLTGVLFAADTGLRLARRPADHNKGWMIGAIAAVLVLLALLRLVPGLGGIVIFALLLFGLGALVRALWLRYAAVSG